MFLGPPNLLDANTLAKGWKEPKATPKATTDLDGDMLQPLIQHNLPAPDIPLCPMLVTQMEGGHVGTQGILSGTFPGTPRAWLSGQAPPTHTSTLS